MTPDDKIPSGSTPSDETLAAWLDGALDSEAAAHVSELAANDKDLAMRALRQQHLDDLVRQAVPAEDAVPAALLELLGLADVAAPAAPASGNVVIFAEARRARGDKVSSPSAAPETQGRGWLRIAAQLALVAGIGLAVVVVRMPGQPASDPAAEYRALGSAPDAATQSVNALVKFAPGTGADAAHALARSAGVQLIGAPGSAGAWKAVVAPGRRAAALDALRADPRVVMADPIDGATP